MNKTSIIQHNKKRIKDLEESVKDLRKALNEKELEYCLLVKEKTSYEGKIKQLENDNENLRSDLKRVLEINEKLNIHVKNLGLRAVQRFVPSSEKRKKDRSIKNGEHSSVLESETSAESAISSADSTSAAESNNKKILSKASDKHDKRGGRIKPPAEIEMIDEILDVNEERRICSVCGKPFQKVGEAEYSFYEFQPARIIIHRVRRPKYVAACGCSEVRSIAEAPPVHVIDKGMASPSLLAFLIVFKYSYHIPLWRQIRMLENWFHVRFTESTLSRWMMKSAEMLSIITDRIHERVMRSQYYVQVDSTTAPFIKDHPDGKVQNGSMWVGCSDALTNLVTFLFWPNGKSEGFEKFMEKFECRHIQTDGHQIYHKMYNSEELMPFFLSCMAHARRKFVDASKLNPDANIIVEKIGKLYAIERRIKDLSAEERFRIRQDDSVPILTEMFNWCESNVNTYTPQELLAKAIAYTLKFREGLTRYCENGHFRIDNNPVERCIRNFVTGRKNWLFFGGSGGGDTSAILFTLIINARMHNLNEFEYITDVLTRLTDLNSLKEIDEMLPDRWKPQKQIEENRDQITSVV